MKGKLINKVFYSNQFQVFNYQFMFATFGVIVSFCVCNVQLQDTEIKFSCQGRPSGYYADVQSGCQIYHMCDTLGRQFSYSCPNTTLFQQRMLICDHWYMVNCSKSEIDYDANLLIGQREKPFVEDDDEHPYHRTPRPDLLAHPSASEYNIVYRTGRAQHSNQKNLVGADTDYPDASTDQPAYFLPSHWSTEYRKSTTQRPGILQKGEKTKKPYYPANNKETMVRVNFKSNFKATTPVYPKIAPTEVPLQSEDFSQNRPKTILQPPVSDAIVKEQSEPPAKINFVSNFKATTPVYPTFVTPAAPLAEDELPPVPNLPYGLSSIVEPPKLINDHFSPPLLGHVQSNEHAVVVNFESNFKATTPVYTKFVTSEKPLAVQEELVDPNTHSLSTVIQPPRGYQQNRENTLIQPNIYYAPPKGDSETYQGGSNDEETTKIVINNLNWKALRRALLIPEYQFPLDASAVRPHYDDQGPSSFQAVPITYEIRQRKHAHL